MLSILKTIVVLAVFVVFAASCSGGDTNQAVSTSQCGDFITYYTVEVISKISHNKANFTQGLQYYNGKLYESTGLYGASSLQRIDVNTGLVELIQTVDDSFFAEGITIVGSQIIQLTWREYTAFVYDLDTLTQEDSFSYSTEGWGLTYDGESLILSDGTSTIYFNEPLSFETKKTIVVTMDGNPVKNINELEYVNGIIYGNIWQDDNIIAICPQNGKVFEVIDASALYNFLEDRQYADVLNGIAYNNDTNTFYLTGKKWDTIFEVSFVVK
ncbi:MAG: glutaminyl-peptide cyclotransferase [Candidatus Magnetoovum sp. WYHC-5]|nr:glutaminyl-peptide cyclotransferase [Candidatus Magnetoovum sp. WYHC-5]